MMSKQHQSALPIELAVGQKQLYRFTGKYQAPPEIREALRQYHLGGFTLFRSFNIEGPAQVRELTAGLQAEGAATGLPLLLIAADQEGGQLMTVGEGVTTFPGNMALGAAGSEELAYRAGHATGLELAAMGINVNYAPVCDVNCNPRNPVVGTRSFGEDPQLVARLAAAMVSGLQAAGVAATAKHFPGHGDTSSDSHYGSPRLDHDINRLRQVELLPFAAAVEAGVRLVMSAHISLPALNDGMDLPATLSPNILRGLLRKEMGFEGVTVSDAMDMGAIQQGDNLVIDAIAAAKAGVDLLLLNFEPAIQTRLSAALLQAARRGLLSAEDVLQSGQRILSLKGWLGQQIQPELSVVGCPEHRALADEIAARALTLVQDREKLLPLRLRPEDRLAVIVPEPQDLTPADTSSTVHPSLAQAIQSYHPHLDEFVIPLNPSEADIAGLRAQAGNYKLIIFASFNATQFPAQAQLANVLLETGRPLIAAALRLPYDLQAYPAVGTYLCTYSILPPAMQALAAGLWGKIPIPGRLPVSLPVL